MALLDMIKGKGKEKDDKYWVNYVENKFLESKNVRTSKYDRQWMVNVAFYKGWQNLKYDKQYGKFVWDKSDFYINLTQNAIRAIRGAVTKYTPMWQVDGLPYGSLDNDSEKILGNFLVNKYDQLGMKEKIKEILLGGLLCSIGVVEYGFDASLDDGNGDVWVEVIDPFDFYIDPVATRLDNARYVIKVVRKPVELIKANPNYQNTKDIGSDGRYSASEYKDKLVTKDLGSSTGRDSETALVYEAWCKQYDEETGGYVINIITTCQNRLLRMETTNYKEFPFCIYKPDVNINEIYGEGWTKNMVPLNRAINELEGATKEYHNIFAKGKYVKRGDPAVKTVTNENGQIITVGAGGNFEVMEMRPMTISVFNQLSNLNRYFQDVSGAQEAFLGRAPQGVTAGVAFEQLVANNMNTVSDLIDNLEIFLADLGERLLALMYEYYDTSRIFRYHGGSTTEDIAIIGQGKALMLQNQKVISLPGRSKIRVSIVSGSGFTKQGRRELLMQLRNGGDIDQQSFLEELGLDAPRIQGRIRDEKFKNAIDQQQLNVILNQPARPTVPPPTPGYQETKEEAAAVDVAKQQPFAGDVAGFGVSQLGNPMLGGVVDYEVSDTGNIEALPSNFAD